MPSFHVCGAAGHLHQKGKHMPWQPCFVVVVAATLLVVGVIADNVIDGVLDGSTVDKCI